MKQAKRLDNAPPYLFVELESKIKKAMDEGVDVINLGIGDPDLPTPDFIVNKMADIIKDKNYHCYPEYDGCIEFRSSVADYYKRKFNVKLDPETEVVALQGSKEGIAHIFFALVDECDFTLVPDPQYPVYRLSTYLAGGIPYPMPLLEENGFLPDLEAIPEEIAERSKILFLNYPNNPTGTVANPGFFQDVVDFSLKHNIVACNDNAYSEFTYDGISSPSILQAKGAMETSVEFHTLSKSYNMTGWRIGYAVGNSEIISKLKNIKQNIDSGVFTAVQIAGREALDRGDGFVKEMKQIYEERKDIALSALDKTGLEYVRPQGTFYIWAKVPEGFTSQSFSDYLFDRCGVVVAPGNGYGLYGEGFIRISLTVGRDRLVEALDRINIYT